MRPRSQEDSLWALELISRAGAMIPPPATRGSSRNDDRGESSPTINEHRRYQGKFCSPAPLNSRGLLPPTSRQPEFYPFNIDGLSLGQKRVLMVRESQIQSSPAPSPYPTHQVMPTREAGTAVPAQVEFCTLGTRSSFFCIYFSQRL